MVGKSLRGAGIRAPGGSKRGLVGRKQQVEVQRRKVNGTGCKGAPFCREATRALGSSFIGSRYGDTLKKVPTIAVRAMASTPQKVTRTAAFSTLEPPTYPASPPKAPRNSREVIETVQLR